MSILRWDAKRDACEPDIVEALERVGVMVWRKLPCDLLTFYRGLWLPLEIKDPWARPDKRQREQQEFLALTKTPIVRTPESALAVVRATRAT
jgi:hypothetical protein